MLMMDIDIQVGLQKQHDAHHVNDILNDLNLSPSNDEGVFIKRPLFKTQVFAVIILPSETIIRIT